MQAGHEVVGLARSDAFNAMGTEARRGDVDDLDGLCEAAAGTDAIIHLAYKQHHRRRQVRRRAGRRPGHSASARRGAGRHGQGAHRRWPDPSATLSATRRSTPAPALPSPARSPG
ncbi:hypothetical protein [Streptomyces sp. R35]